jgi:hypothetical protein
MTQAFTCEGRTMRSGFDRRGKPVEFWVEVLVAVGDSGVSAYNLSRFVACLPFCAYLFGVRLASD